MQKGGPIRLSAQDSGGKGKIEGWGLLGGTGKGRHAGVPSENIKIFMQKLTCAGCGKTYWPNQSWVHKDCVVVNAPVVNDVANVVVNARTGDRHRKTPERAEYVRMKMREYRKKRAVRG
jgi:hypothetical protein